MVGGGERREDGDWGCETESSEAIGCHFEAPRALGASAADGPYLYLGIWEFVLLVVAAQSGAE